MPVQGPRDRRQRELYPTAKGRSLALDLAAPQSRRIAEALRGGAVGEREAVQHFLRAMVTPALRRQVDGRGAVDEKGDTDER